MGSKLGSFFKTLISRRGLVAITSFVVILVILIALFFAFKKVSRQVPACSQLSSSFSVFSDQSTRNDIAKLKNVYNSASKNKYPENCISTTDTQKNDLSKLIIYRQMAISAYSYADDENVKDYASQTLNYNEKVEDSYRGDKVPKKSEVKKQMEGILNGNY